MDGRAQSVILPGDSSCSQCQTRRFAPVCSGCGRILRVRREHLATIRGSNGFCVKHPSEKKYFYDIVDRIPDVATEFWVKVPKLSWLILAGVLVGKATLGLTSCALESDTTICSTQHAQLKCLRARVTSNGVFVFLCLQGAQVWIPDPDVVWKGASLLEDYKDGKKQITLKYEGENEVCTCRACTFVPVDLENVRYITAEERLSYLREFCPNSVRGYRKFFC